MDRDASVDFDEFFHSRAPALLRSAYQSEHDQESELDPGGDSEQEPDNGPNASPAGSPNSRTMASPTRRSLRIGSSGLTAMAPIGSTPIRSAMVRQVASPTASP
jgi:hypothetical protein